MEFLSIYGALCQRLSPYTQVNNANMFRLSDSEGLIGIKKSGILTIVVKAVEAPASDTSREVNVSYKRRFPYLQIIVIFDGVVSYLYNLNTKTHRYCQNIDELSNVLISAIRGNHCFRQQISLPYISQRNNIDSKPFYGKQILLFDDHRTTLDILFEIYKSRQLEGIVPNLITFDYHEDCCDAGSGERLLERIGVQNLMNATDRQFWNFVEFDLSPNDDDWISAAITLHLVRDVVIIGKVENDNVDNHRNNQDDAHHLFSINHIPQSIDNCGCLGDSMISEPYYAMVRDTMEYHHQSFDDGYVYPFVLDIDLDCFSTLVFNKQMAWPEEVFVKEYVENEKVFIFMKQLIERAALITISREPGCCGGYEESFKILSYLNRYFFEGAIF